MKARYFLVSGDLWVSMLQAGHEQHFKVKQNGLPEDAKCVKTESTQNGRDVAIWVTSSVFQPSDPDELPLPILERIP